MNDNLEVQSARISQWFNSDHENSVNNYLRANGKLRRLTASGEFSGFRERPEMLDYGLILDLNLFNEQINITLGSLCKWVDEVYSSFNFDISENILRNSMNSVRRKEKSDFQY